MYLAFTLGIAENSLVASVGRVGRLVVWCLVFGGVFGRIRNMWGLRPPFSSESHLCYLPTCPLVLVSPPARQYYARRALLKSAAACFFSFRASHGWLFLKLLRVETAYSTVAFFFGNT